MTCQHGSFLLCLNLTSALKLFLDKKEKKKHPKGEVTAWTWHVQSRAWLEICDPVDVSSLQCLSRATRFRWNIRTRITFDVLLLSDCITWEAHLQLRVSLQTAGAVHNVHQVDGGPGEGHSVAAQPLAELLRLAAQLLQLLFVLQLIMSGTGQNSI